jgi:hypothetical protein
MKNCLIPIKKTNHIVVGINWCQGLVIKMGHQSMLYPKNYCQNGVTKHGFKKNKG